MYFFVIYYILFSLNSNKYKKMASINELKNVLKETLEERGVMS